MFPILYENIETGVVPEHFGLGVLSDALSCEVEQVKNSIYELVVTYPITGIHAKEIANMRYLKVKSNFTDPAQLFQIKRVGKAMNGKFKIYCQHISYLLSGFDISSGEANNAASACLLLESAANGFSITTDKDVTAAFIIDIPASVKSYFIGRKGSFADVYGPTEIKYDNFNVQMLLHAGQDRGVTIRYGKNLLELSQELDCSNLYTHVLCYWKSQEGTVVSGNKITTGLTLDAPNTLILDCSSDFEEMPTAAELDERAAQYISNNNLTVPKSNIKLDFVQSGELTNRVDLCDTVTIYYEALGISGQAKCIRTKWDCLKERYIETEFGDVKADLTDTIAAQTSEINEALSTAETAAMLVSSKVDQSAMEVAIRNATNAITGNAGGEIVLHDSNGDGKPDELLILDTGDINTAVDVWRFNKDGWGHSSTGYNGTYHLAFLGTGEGVADAITTGTLDASRVTIQHLTATMIQGGKLTLGGYNNLSGTFELLNEQGIKIGEMGNAGLKFYGDGAEGARPYVLINNTVGFAGYDANDSEIFKVSRDSFVMKKCVAEEEIAACNKVRFIPITLRSGNTVTNDGIALVALVETGV